MVSFQFSVFSFQFSVFSFQFSVFSGKWEVGSGKWGDLLVCLVSFSRVGGGDLRAEFDFR